MRSASLITAILLGASAAAAAADKPLVPLDSFMQEEEFSTPRISPDGKHIALNVRIMRLGRMIPTMTVYTLPDLKIVSTIALPRFEIPADFMWATNRRLVVEKGLEIGLRERPIPTGEVVAIDIDGTKSEYLYGYDNFKFSSRGDRYGDDYGYGTVVSIPEPRDGTILLGSYQWRSEHSMLYSINSVNATRKLLADISVPNLDFIIQHDGKPRFAFGTDEDSLAVLYRVNEASGAWERVPAKTLGHSFRPFAFTPNDAEFYASYSEHGDQVSIVRESVSDGKRTVVAADPRGNVELWELTAKPWQPFAVATETGIPTPRYLDESLPDARLHKQLSQQFPGSYVHFINFTDDGRKLLFSVASDRDPGSFYLYDRASNKAELLFSNMQQIDPDQMAERRPIRFKARDGLELTGYLTLPANPGKKKLPMVLMPHGGPHGVADTWYFDLDAQFLASRGYAVLQVNFRGSGGRGPNFRKAGFHEWGGKMMDDLSDGVTWAAGQPDIDGSRVCAYGASFGGYAALMLPVREQSMFKCAVGYAGAYDLAYVFEEKRVKNDKRSLSYYKRVLGQDAAELARFSPSMQADKIKIPVLLVHGEKDEICPPEHATRMRDSLTKAGRPPEWMMVANEGHGFYDIEHRKAFYQKLESFLARHIGL